jgi:hypothetical protein
MVAPTIGDPVMDAATMPAADMPEYERLARSLPEDLLCEWRATRVSDVERADARRVEELRALLNAADRAVAAEMERCHTYTRPAPHGIEQMMFNATPLLRTLNAVAKASRQALKDALLDYREISDVTPGPLLIELLHVRINEAGGSREWCAAAEAQAGVRFRLPDISGVMDRTALWMLNPFEPMWERLVGAMQAMDAARRQAAT